MGQWCVCHRSVSGNYAYYTSLSVKKTASAVLSRLSINYWYHTRNSVERLCELGLMSGNDIYMIDSFRELLLLGNCICHWVNGVSKLHQP